MNAHTSLSVVGVGQSLTAATLPGSICTSPGRIIIPRYSIESFLNSHFSQIEVVMFQPFEYLPHYLTVLLKILAIDENVIHIDRYFPFCYEICKYRVHEGLEGCQTVGHSEIHDFWLVQPPISHYSSLPFISFTYTNVVIAPSDVKLSEIPCLHQPVDNICR